MVVQQKTPLHSRPWLLISACVLPVFNPSVLSTCVLHNNQFISACTYCGVEATEATGKAMATGEAIIAGEVMATGEAEVQSVHTTLDSRIVASLLLLAIQLAQV